MNEIKEHRFVIIGLEYNMLRMAEAYRHISKCGLLVTTQELSKAKIFKSLDLAERKMRELKSIYDVYTWYIIQV